MNALTRALATEEARLRTAANDHGGSLYRHAGRDPFDWKLALIISLHFAGMLIAAIYMGA